MSSAAFCIVCGGEPPLTSDRMCEGCLRKRVILSKIPEVIQQHRCPKCSAYDIHGRWSKMDTDPLADLRVRDALEIDSRAENLNIGFSVEIIDERTSRIHIDVSGVVETFDFADSHEILLQTSNAICLPCTRKDGAYFEAIVQLRSAGRRLDKDELKLLRSTLDQMLAGMEADSMFFITKEGPVTGGWDLQVGSKAMARMWGRILAKQFGGTIKETNTTVGMKDGIEITRLTLSYRKPAYDIGDVMKLKNHYWMIDSWQKDGPILRRMKFFERTGASWRDMEKARIICPVAEQHTVDILNRDSTAAEVMDPIDYRMVTVGLPYDDDSNTTKIRIALIEDNWVAVPGITVEDSK